MSERSERKITADEAVIRTATIQIQTLTLNNKQMTLAVFRQLPNKELLDYESGLLLGEAWGTVNYHIDCPKDEDTDKVLPHVHVVWQSGAVLCRCAFDTNCPDKSHALPFEDVARRLLILRALAGEWDPGPERSLRSEFLVSVGGQKMSIWVPEHIYQVNAEDEWSRNRAREELMRWLAGIPSDITPTEYQAIAVTPRAEILKKFRQNWAESKARIDALPQLFIAV